MIKNARRISKGPEGPRWDVNTDIFSRSHFRRSVGTIEFKYFKDLALPRVKAAAASVPRFKSLEEHFGFHVDDPGEDNLELSFGSRSMPYKDAQGRIVEEKGASLRYTLAPTGEAAVILRPATSSLSRPVEDHLYLRIGRYSGQYLARRLASDLRDLVAYGCVTSLDADATAGEKMRVWWLRRSRPVQIGGAFVPASVLGQPRMPRWPW